MKIIVKELEPTTSIDMMLDLKGFIHNSVDLDALNDVNVVGNILKDDETVVLELHVTANVIQKCARTLKPVHYPLAFDTEIVFSKDEDILDYILEETIELDAIIFAEILLEKEPFVYHESADENAFEEPKKDSHPAFESLKDKQ